MTYCCRIGPALLAGICIVLSSSIPTVAAPDTGDTQDSPSPDAVGTPDRSAVRSIAGPLVSLGMDGRLVYKPYDERGDVIPDFSNCGYRGGGVALPDAPVKLTVSPSADADDTPRLQKALDQIAAMPLDASGLRGALLLKPGTYHVADQLKIRVGGVVLRGSGQGENGTLMIATGTGARPLIDVGGAEGLVVDDKAAVKIADHYVPVGARTFNVVDAGRFKPGDTVLVRRHGNAKWVSALQMDKLIERNGTKQWTAFTMTADRVITAVNGSAITIDAPVVCAIDAQWGGGDVAPYTEAGRIENVGVEQIRTQSTFDPTVTSTVGVRAGAAPYASDENHATAAIFFDNCKNAWARDVVSEHFVSGVMKVGKSAKWITVQDSAANDPVSIITGGRRYAFCIEGQLSLVLRCTSRSQRHAFINNGAHTPGPNAFVDCSSENDFADSGPHQRWSAGTLYDNVSGVMHTQDRQNMGSGHGWAGANDVYWNCRGKITIEQPQTAENFAFGFVGLKQKPAFPQIGHPEGYYESFGTPMPLRSLYEQQLAERLGKK